MFSKYDEFYRSVYYKDTKGPLTPKVKFLIGLAAALTSGCETWTRNNFAAAKKAGASLAELGETVQIAMIGAGNKIRALAEMVSDEPLVDVETSAPVATSQGHSAECGK